MPGTLQAFADASVRRVGPRGTRREWITEIGNEAFLSLGGHCDIAGLVQNPVVWHHTVGYIYKYIAKPCSIPIRGLHDPSMAR